MHQRLHRILFTAFALSTGLFGVDGRPIADLCTSKLLGEGWSHPAPTPEELEARRIVGVAEPIHTTERFRRAWRAVAAMAPAESTAETVRLRVEFLTRLLNAIPHFGYKIRETPDGAFVFEAPAAQDSQLSRIEFIAIRPSDGLLYRGACIGPLLEGWIPDYDLATVLVAKAE